MKSLFAVLTLCGALICAPASQADSFAAMEIEPLSEKIVAADFTLPGLDGNESKLADYRGKVVLLNFWATWCAPCLREMPGMEVLSQKFGDKDFVVLGISNDQASHNKRVATFIKRLNLTFPVLLDTDGKVSEYFSVSGIPVSFLIARDGSILAHIVGEREWGGQKAFDLIEHLLNRS